jgi:ATP-dependent DNA ligase
VATRCCTSPGLRLAPPLRSVRIFSYLFFPIAQAHFTLHSNPEIMVPTGTDRIHEIKHDGYRLIVQREGTRAAFRPQWSWKDR